MDWKAPFPKEHIYWEQHKGILYCSACLVLLSEFPEESIDCVITSPPYWKLRDYGVKGQIGLETTFQEYLEKLWNIFDEIKRILKPTGTCWINLGDTYMNNSSYSRKGRQGFNSKESSMYKKDKVVKQKSLCMIPERFAIGMIERGWLLRNSIVWAKKVSAFNREENLGNGMPSSVKDRVNQNKEYVYFFTKSKKYHFDKPLMPYKTPLNRWGGMALAPTGKSVWDEGTKQSTYRDRDMRPNPKGAGCSDTWLINTAPSKYTNFAVFPEKLPEICIKAGCPERGIVLDPFAGMCTSLVVAHKLGRKWIGIEINKEYCTIFHSYRSILGSKI